MSSQIKQLPIIQLVDSHGVDLSSTFVYALNAPAIQVSS